MFIMLFYFSNRLKSFAKPHKNNIYGKNMVPTVYNHNLKFKNKLSWNQEEGMLILP